MIIGIANPRISEALSLVMRTFAMADVEFCSLLEFVRAADKRIQGGDIEALRVLEPLFGLARLIEDAVRTAKEKP